MPLLILKKYFKVLIKKNMSLYIDKGFHIVSYYHICDFRKIMQIENAAIA